jgi:hypothetical protein
LDWLIGNLHTHRLEDLFVLGYWEDAADLGFGVPLLSSDIDKMLQILTWDKDLLCQMGVDNYRNEKDWRICCCWLSSHCTGGSDSTSMIHASVYFGPSHVIPALASDVSRS